ncbi:hypothetical protein [Ideonella sp. BN130291]|uniref:hypothetical protein n=1 Tax=Ideonella sp. BN130291 TaxID=3112940 RepID=UPI002E269C6F|nr:hypothetical protein [Ideonella sp. BN130291]
MNTSFFLLSLCLPVFGPLLAVTYLRPILIKVLRGFCDAEGGAEFWVRSAYLLAVCGTLLLWLSFGFFDSGVDPLVALRRTLWLVLAGVFATVAFIATKVWSQVSALLGKRWVAAADGAAP